MSYEHPHILYVGAAQIGRAFQLVVESDGWQVDLPTDVDEALALYIVNYPDVVILGGAMGEQVFDYLQPMFSGAPLGIRALLMLGDTAPYLPNTVTAHVPPNAQISDLIAAVRSLLDEKQWAYQPLTLPIG